MDFLLGYDQIQHLVGPQKNTSSSKRSLYNENINWVIPYHHVIPEIYLLGIKPIVKLMYFNKKYPENMLIQKKRQHLKIRMDNNGGYWFTASSLKTLYHYIRSGLQQFFKNLMNFPEFLYLDLKHKYWIQEMYKDLAIIGNRKLHRLIEEETFECLKEQLAHNSDFETEEDEQEELNVDSIDKSKDFTK